MGGASKLWGSPQREVGFASPDQPRFFPVSVRLRHDTPHPPLHPFLPDRLPVRSPRPLLARFNPNRPGVAARLLDRRCSATCLRCPETPAPSTRPPPRKPPPLQGYPRTQARRAFTVGHYLTKWLTSYDRRLAAGGDDALAPLYLGRGPTAPRDSMRF